MAMAAPAATAARDPDPDQVAWETFGAGKVPSSAQPETPPKKSIQKCLKQLALKKKQEVANINQLNEAANNLKEHSEAAKIWLTGKFTELRLLLDEEEMTAKQFIDKNTQKTFKTYDEQVELCQERINIINNLSKKVQRIHEQQDPVHLLKDYTVSEKEIIRQMSPAEVCHPVPVTFEHEKNYYRNLAKDVCTTLQVPLEVRLKEEILTRKKEKELNNEQVQMSNRSKSKTANNIKQKELSVLPNFLLQFPRLLFFLERSLYLVPIIWYRLRLPSHIGTNTCSQPSVSYKSKSGTLLKMVSTPERSLFLKYARIPTLEPDTMHPRLRLSDDRLTVTCVWMGKIQLCNPQRFDKLWQVLSRDSFFSGSHYWEVDLLNSGIGWWLGVAYPSIKRKGNSEASRLGFNRQSWCLKRFDLEYWAFHNGERTRITVDQDPERIGIFLDYEAGILSFYDITCGMSHLHTFRSRFQEPLYPALRLWEGSITILKLP